MFTKVTQIENRFRSKYSHEDICRSNLTVCFRLCSDLELAMLRWIEFDAVEALINHEEVMNTITEIRKQDVSVRTANHKDIV